jgi:hypothetical protein
MKYFGGVTSFATGAREMHFDAENAFRNASENPNRVLGNPPISNSELKDNSERSGE